MTKKPSEESNQYSNDIDLNDISSVVYRSLELDTNSVFKDFYDSSEILNFSTISDLGLPVKRNEAIELVNSSYANNLNSSVSISMPYILNHSNSNCSLKSVDHTLFDVKELEYLQHDGSDGFASTNSHDLNLSEKANSDNDENSNKTLFCVIDEDKKTYSSNFLSSGKTLNSEANAFTPKSFKSNGNAHKCPYCLKSFGIPSRLKRHIKTHKIRHNDSEAEEGTASLRSISMIRKRVDFDSESTVCEKRQNVLHTQTDKRCPKCLMSFKCPSKLLRHIKTHVGLKSYICHLCSKTFLEEFNLIAHIRIHLNYQPYNCEKCERAFNIKSNLTRHMRSHRREVQFTCCKCGKRCSSENKLAIHFRTHEKVPYSCPECEKVFKKKYNLNRHVKIHSNEREHCCSFCDYRARQIYHLEKHIQRKHAE